MLTKDQKIYLNKILKDATISEIVGALSTDDVITSPLISNGNIWIIYRKNKEEVEVIIKDDMTFTACIRLTEQEQNYFTTKNLKYLTNE